MKLLRMMSGTEHYIQDDEAENLSKIVETKKFAILRSGAMIRTTRIEEITEVPTEKFWKGHRLSKDGRSFMRDGDRIYLEPHNYAEIDIIPITLLNPQATLITIDTPKKETETINQENLDKIAKVRAKYLSGHSVNTLRTTKNRG